MPDQMNEDTDRCYAYNMDGQRCELIAGHDDLHTVTKSWGPDECWAPGKTVEVTLQEYGVPRIVTPLETQPSAPTVCVLCDHPFHRGKCHDADGEYACDCAEGIA